MAQLTAFVQQRNRHGYRRQRTAPLPSRTAKSRNQSQLGVDGLDVAYLATLNDGFSALQVSSRCLVDDWFYARSRPFGPLHRWLMDNAAAELPALSTLVEYGYGVADYARPPSDIATALETSCPALSKEQCCVPPFRHHDLPHITTASLRCTARCCVYKDR